jgi:fructokinase
MYDFISIGEILIDFTPYQDGVSKAPLFQQNPGGAPANVACVMAKLGKKAAFIGKVGDDSFGASCKQALMDAGVDSRHLVASKKFGTTLAFVVLKPGGDRDFSFYRNETTADVNLLPEDIDPRLYSDAKVFHFGSVALTQEPSRSTVFHAISEAKRQGALISYDPNLRPPLWKSMDEAKVMILKGIPYADVLKISDEEYTFLFGDEPEEVVGKRLNEQTPFVLITKAKAGCTAYVNGARYDSQAYDVKTIDTTGAGDSFLAGILYHLVNCGKPIASLTPDEIRHMLDFSNALGSLVTTKRGAIAAIPTFEEIETCMAEVSRLTC